MLLTQLETHLLASAIGKAHWGILAGIITRILIRIRLISSETGILAAPYTGTETRIVSELFYKIRSNRASTPTTGDAYISSTTVTRTEIYREGITIFIAIVIVGRVQLQVQDNLLRKATLSCLPGLSVIPLACIGCFPGIVACRRSILGTRWHPEIGIVLLQLIATVFYHIIDGSSSLSLGTGRMLFAIITCIIKVRASQQCLSSILGDATIIGITVLQRISISRNIGSSKLQVIEDGLIYFLHWSTWNVSL